MQIVICYFTRCYFIATTKRGQLPQAMHALYVRSFSLVDAVDVFVCASLHAMRSPIYGDDMILFAVIYILWTAWQTNQYVWRTVITKQRCKRFPPIPMILHERSRKHFCSTTECGILLFLYAHFISAKKWASGEYVASSVHQFASISFRWKSFVLQHTEFLKRYRNWMPTQFGLSDDL